MFEACRVLELLVKRMIAVSGNTFTETHELEALVKRFSLIIRNQYRPSMPFLFVAGNVRKNFYAIRIFGSQIELLKKVGGVYTQIASADFHYEKYLDDVLSFKFIVGHNCARLLHEDNIVISCSDLSIKNNEVVRWFNCSPNQERIRKLEELLKILRAPREQSFYSEKEFS